jgi:hypothetical protein
MLFSRPSSTTCMNVFERIWTTHKSLGSLGISSKGQTPMFNTPRFVQRLEVKLDEHKIVATIFQLAMKQCTYDKYFA